MDDRAQILNGDIAAPTTKRSGRSFHPDADTVLHDQLDTGPKDGSWKEVGGFRLDTNDSYVFRLDTTC